MENGINRAAKNDRYGNRSGMDIQRLKWKTRKSEKLVW